MVVELIFSVTFKSFDHIVFHRDLQCQEISPDPCNLNSSTSIDWTPGNCDFVITRSFLNVSSLKGKSTVLQISGATLFKSPSVSYIRAYGSNNIRLSLISCVFFQPRVKCAKIKLAKFYKTDERRQHEEKEYVEDAN